MRCHLSIYWQEFHMDLSQKLHFVHFFHTKRIVFFDIDSFRTVVKYLYTQWKPFFSFKAYFTLISPTEDLLLGVKNGGYVGGAVLGVANK